MVTSFSRGLGKCVCVSHPVVSDSPWSHGLLPARPFCPWNSPGKYRMGCHFLQVGQIVFLNLLHCSWVGHPVPFTPYMKIAQYLRRAEMEPIIYSISVLIHSSLQLWPKDSYLVHFILITFGAGIIYSHQRNLEKPPREEALVSSPFTRKLQLTPLSTWCAEFGQGPGVVPRSTPYAFNGDCMTPQNSWALMKSIK